MPARSSRWRRPTTSAGTGMITIPLSSLGAVRGFGASRRRSAATTVADIIGGFMLPARSRRPRPSSSSSAGCLRASPATASSGSCSAIYGFILGALLASSFMGTEQTLWMMVAAIVGGLVGALILIVAYFAGVALLGARYRRAGGAPDLGRRSAASRTCSMRDPVLRSPARSLRWRCSAMSSSSRPPSAAPGRRSSARGALAGTAGRRQAAATDVWLASIRSTPRRAAAGIAVRLVLGAVGVLVQLAVTAKDKK